MNAQTITRDDLPTESPVNTLNASARSLLYAAWGRRRIMGTLVVEGGRDLSREQLVHLVRGNVDTARRRRLGFQLTVDTVDGAHGEPQRLRAAYLPTPRGEG